MLFKQKNILITFGRSMWALAIARQLSANGHRIFTADSLNYHICSFSKKIIKNYKVDSPRFNPSSYVSSIIKIIKEEKIDLLLPIFEETSILSKYRDHFPSHCEVFCPSFELYHEIHNKWLFHTLLQKLGIKNLKACLVRSQDELQSIPIKGPFALKECYSRASQKVIKVLNSHNLPLIKIEPHNPLIAQEWMEGNRFCSYTICHEGKIYAHSLYPVSYAIGGKSCLLFEHVNHSEIYDWVNHFVSLTNYTGQIAFDFIESSEKVLYAIECNPRATSGSFLFNESDRLDHAFFRINSEPILPSRMERKQIAIGMLLYGWRSSSLVNLTLYNFFTDFFSSKDVVFRTTDIKPYLFQPLIFFFLIIKSSKHGLNIPSFFTYDHNWNGEALPDRLCYTIQSESRGDH